MLHFQYAITIHTYQSMVNFDGGKMFCHKVFQKNLLKITCKCVCVCVCVGVAIEFDIVITTS